jgi:mannitol/fructose-specific phosphotransferase system IIA component (Ntr-type)
VVDLPASACRDDLLHLVAEGLTGDLGIDPEEVCVRLRRREDLSSTVVRPGLAIPHVIMEGVPSLRVVLARSRQGVAFAGEETPVHVVFALAAPPGDRNLYLRALVAIAEIAQEGEFDRRWMAAGSPEALREVVLAAERRRDHGPGEPGPDAG